jgi:hypothetical protein
VHLTVEVLDERRLLSASSTLGELFSLLDGPDHGHHAGTELLHVIPDVRAEVGPGSKADDSWKELVWELRADGLSGDLDDRLSALLNHDHDGKHANDRGHKHEDDVAPDRKDKQLKHLDKLLDRVWSHLHKRAKHDDLDLQPDSGNSAGSGGRSAGTPAVMLPPAGETSGSGSNSVVIQPVPAHTMRALPAVSAPRPAPEASSSDGVLPGPNTTVQAAQRGVTLPGTGASAASQPTAIRVATETQPAAQSALFVGGVVSTLASDSGMSAEVPALEAEHGLARAFESAGPADEVTPAAFARDDTDILDRLYETGIAGEPLAVPPPESFGNIPTVWSDPITAALGDDVARFLPAFTAVPLVHVIPEMSDLLATVLPVDVVALEASLGRLLDGINRWGEELAALTEDTWIPPWLIAAVLATAACEVARRQMKKPALALNTGGVVEDDTVTWLPPSCRAG